MASSYHYYLVLIAFVFPILYYCYTPWLLFPLFISLSVLLGGGFALLKGSYELRRIETQPRPPKPITDPILYRMKVYPQKTLLPTLVSNNVDDRILNVIRLVLEHHVKSFYSIVAPNHEQFFASLIPEVWKVLHVLLKRISQIDTLKLISHDAIEGLRKHFLYFRAGTNTISSAGQQRVFPDLNSFPFLENEEKELEFLRKAVEALLCVCLEKEYLECSPVRILIREFLVCKLVHPTIESICDPDYINQRLLKYLLNREELTKGGAQKRYAHSETYEDFMQHIKKCEDIDELTHIRQSIITDIVQAKAVQRMKETSSTGFRVSNLPVDVSADKAKMLMERDLKLYITQLTTAKSACERQIRKCGGEDYQQDYPSEGEHARSDFPRPIPFETVMKNEKCLTYFKKFLDRSNYGDLLLFWSEAQLVSLSETPLQDIKYICTKYLIPGAECLIYPNTEQLSALDTALNSELFDTDVSSPSLEALMNIQRSVYRELYEQHYESFLYSEDFKEFMEGEQSDIGLSYSFNAASGITSADNVYQKKLTVLKRKLSDKDTALASLPKENKASEARVKRLEKGKTELEQEIKQLQRYIEHTEEWFGTVGKWNVEVTSVDTAESEGHDKNPLMILVIHRPESIDRSSSLEESTGITSKLERSIKSKDSAFSSAVGTTARSTSSVATKSIVGGVSTKSIISTVPGTATSSEKSYSLDDGSDDGVISLCSDDEVPKCAGWVIGRKLSEFTELHQKIAPVCPHILFPPLPRKATFPFMKKDDNKYWNSYRNALQVYINKVIHDQKLIESEEVFNFLSPASADFRTKEGKPLKVRQDVKSEESILDSVSSLVSEVFELRDKSRVLRKQLYDLAQLTFGRGMEGELQDFMKWTLSEPMLVYYVETFQNSMWPNGQPSTASPDRSDEEKETTMESAKEHFIKCAPQTLQTVLGNRNCQIGFQKIFRAFQDRNANKQLFYSCFELLIYALIPELEGLEMDNITSSNPT